MTNDDRPSDPLAQALAKLAPLPASLTTPAFYFAAGAAQAARGTAYWKRLCLGQTGLMTIAAGAAAVWLSAGPTPTEPNATQKTRQTTATPLELAPHPREHNAGLPDYRGTPEMIGFRLRSDDADASDAEIAYYLQLRNDVAAVGLSVLPTSPRAYVPPENRDIGPPIFAVPPMRKNERN